MKTNTRKNIILAGGSLLAIGLSAHFIWKNHFAPPKINQALHQGVGVALAEETIRVLENKGDILVITMEDRDSDILATQFRAFRERLGSSGVEIKDVERIDSEKKDKYGPGIGLSASKLTRELKKAQKRRAIVSFVGLPKLDDAELRAIGDSVPRLITYSRMSEKLGPLFDRGWIASAVVPRFKFPAPGPEVPVTQGEWFTNQYQVIWGSVAEREK